MSLFIGLGSGRCGTRSLATLMNAQPGAVCFHEMNPSGMAWTGAEPTVRATVRGFEGILEGDPPAIPVDMVRQPLLPALEKLREAPSVRLIGDVASYYLPYVDLIFALHPDTRMICLRRDRAETVASFAAIVRPRMGVRERWLRHMLALAIGRPAATARNHWIDHDGEGWRPDPVWDKNFPSFEADGLEEAIGAYWDHYYEQAEALAARHGERFRIAPLEALGTAEGRAGLLSFAGLGEGIESAPVWENADRAQRA